jgi:hypothetical protein
MGSPEAGAVTNATEAAGKRALRIAGGVALVAAVYSSSMLIFPLCEWIPSLSNVLYTCTGIGLTRWGPLVGAIAVAIWVGRRDAPWVFLGGWAIAAAVGAAHYIHTSGQDPWQVVRHVVTSPRVMVYNGCALAICWWWPRRRTLGSAPTEAGHGDEG